MPDDDEFKAERAIPPLAERPFSEWKAKLKKLSDPQFIFSPGKDRSLWDSLVQEAEDRGFTENTETVLLGIIYHMTDNRSRETTTLAVEPDTGYDQLMTFRKLVLKKLDEKVGKVTPPEPTID